MAEYDNLCTVTVIVVSSRLNYNTLTSKLYFTFCSSDRMSIVTNPNIRNSSVCVVACRLCLVAFLCSDSSSVSSRSMSSSSEANKLSVFQSSSSLLIPNNEFCDSDLESEDTELFDVEISGLSASFVSLPSELISSFIFSVLLYDSVSVLSSSLFTAPLNSATVPDEVEGSSSELALFPTYQTTIVDNTMRGGRESSKKLVMLFTFIIVFIITTYLS
jgi:hypothetical protein